MEHSSTPADILVRFFVPSWSGRMPSALYDRRGTYRSDEEWRERNAEAADVNLEPKRVVGDLRFASLFNLLSYDLAKQGYVLARVNLHQVEQRQGGKQWMVTLGFTHRSAKPEVWRNREVVDWIQSRFVGTGVEDIKTGMVSVVVPRDTRAGQDAILVNVLSPTPAKENAPVFQLRFDANGFWVQDPDDPAGAKEISVGDANTLSLRHTATERAQSEAGAASNGVLREGGNVEKAKAAAYDTALMVFWGDCRFEDAKARAEATVEAFDWEKKVARFAAK